jgi:cell pole-organizing protein PopZ
MEEILDAIRRIIYDIPKDQPVPEHLKKQYLSPEGKEPSMEEIMASIRRIITSDDTEETKSVVPPKAPEPFKEPSMEEIMASIGRIIDSDDTEEAKPVEPPKAPEPPKERSMDEILASIRDIIAADSHPEPNPMITLLVTINGTLNGIRDLLDKRLPEPPVKPTEEIDSQVILAAIHQIVTDAEIPEIAARFGLTPQQVVFFKTEMEKNQRKAAIPVEKPIVQDKMNLTAEERQAAEWAALAEDEFDNDMKRKGGGVRVLNEREIDSLMGFDREDEPSLTQPAAKSGSIPEGIRFPNCRQCRLFQEHLTQPRCGHGEAPPWTPEEISIARQHPLYGDFRPASCPFKGA